VVRIWSILCKVEAVGGATKLDFAVDAARLTFAEAQLLLATARFLAAVSQAVRDLEPYHVADHVFRLAKEFNS